MSIYIQFGPTRRSFTIAPGSNLQCIRSNPNYQAALGFSRDDQALVNGVPAADDTILTDGDTVSFVNRPHEKA